MIMKAKRIFSIIASAALALSAGAQQSAHDNYVGVSFGGGMNTLLFNPANGQQSVGGGIEAGLFYARFFNKTVGLGVGLQYTWANASALYNYNEVNTGLVHPSNPNQLYNLTTGFRDWKEQQTVGVLSIPVEALFRHSFNDNWSLIGGAGLSLDFPIHGTYTPKGGDYTTTGVFPALGNYELSDLPEHGFSTYTKIPGSKINNLAKVGISLIGDFGFRYAFNNNWGLYMGMYIGYGLTNMIQSQEAPLVLIDDAREIAYAGTFGSTEVSKVNLMRFGVKVAVDFGWPAKDKAVEPIEPLAPAPEPAVDEEAERLAREKAEAERLAREEAERLAREQAEAERLAREKAEAERLAAEQAAREQAEKEAAWSAFKQRVDDINVYFDNSKVEPAISERDKAAIDELCAFLKENREYKVIATGHTDNYGDPEQNLKVWGMQRAEVLKAYMVKQGVSEDQIRCESKGQTEPVAPNDTRANRALNRRANIRFE